MIQRYVVTHWFRLVSAHPHKTISQLARNQFDFPKGIFIQISCWHLVSVRTHRILFSFIPLFITLFNNQYNSSNSIGELNNWKYKMNWILFCKKYLYEPIFLKDTDTYLYDYCKLTSTLQPDVLISHQKGNQMSINFFADPLIPRLCTNDHKLCPLNRTSCRSWTS